MWIQVNNEGGDLLAWLTGTYAAGTTNADYEAYVASGSGDPPAWWSQAGVVFVPEGAQEVWEIQAQSGVTALCFIDAARFWEVAGPRITE